MQEIRCGKCNRLLAKGEALDLAIKCPRCGAINHVRDKIPDTEGQGASNKEAPHGRTQKAAPPSGGRTRS
ncbi:Mu-like prophage FluMu protein Com [Humidesulfovibrio mexicanus]|uniref:Mu-like prophage FluMu protein Com n=1 Tax=Humidesulfovibrio mexicanus TaxID=147047 RepID=A0A239CNZ9_9BACT|nr:Com family DNA-binding transcriptional regulator [Humidesulfovibrio mexicanus]SNS21867.1 Mu-like prophage FluMu protein Com [Humidesulfovibrio mexicanus]